MVPSAPELRWALAMVLTHGVPSHHTGKLMTHCCTGGPMLVSSSHSLWCDVLMQMIPWVGPSSPGRSVPSLRSFAHYGVCLCVSVSLWTSGGRQAGVYWDQNSAWNINRWERGWVEEYRRHALKRNCQWGCGVGGGGVGWGHISKFPMATIPLVRGVDFNLH